jgi:hypothetical protein
LSPWQQLLLLLSVRMVSMVSMANLVQKDPREMGVPLVPREIVV